MTFIQIFVIKLNELNALVLFESWKLFELLPKDKETKSHGCVFIKVVKAFELISVSSVLRIRDEVTDVIGHGTARRSLRLICCLGFVKKIKSFALFIQSFAKPESFSFSCFYKHIDCCFVKYAWSWTQKVSSNKTSCSTKHMNTSSSGCIMIVYLMKPSFTNDPRWSDRINYCRHQYTEYNIAINIAPFS